MSQANKFSFKQFFSRFNQKSFTMKALTMLFVLVLAMVFGSKLVGQHAPSVTTVPITPTEKPFDLSNVTPVGDPLPELLDERIVFKGTYNGTDGVWYVNPRTKEVTASTKPASTYGNYISYLRDTGAIRIS